MQYNTLKSDTIPEISIIVPMYNTQKYISRTLDSIFKQTFKSCEIILVNDGSTDNSLEVAENKLKKDSPFPFKIITQKNMGVGTCKNTGLKNATGNYCALIDSDDYIDPGFLHDLYKIIKENSVDVAFSLYQNVSDSDFEKLPVIAEDNRLYKREEIFNRFLIRNINIVQPSILINRKFLEDNNIYFYDKVRFSEDVIYVWLTILNSDKIGVLGKTSYNYYQRAGSIMHSTPIEKFTDAYKFYKDKIFVPQNKNLENLPIDLILPRWIIGVMNTASRILSFEDFKKLLNQLEYKTHLKKLKNFPDKRVRILAFIARINLFVYYKLMKNV